MIIRADRKFSICIFQADDRCTSNDDGKKSSELDFWIVRCAMNSHRGLKNRNEYK